VVPEKQGLKPRGAPGQWTLDRFSLSSGSRKTRIETDEKINIEKLKVGLSSGSRKTRIET